MSTYVRVLCAVIGALLLHAHSLLAQSAPILSVAVVITALVGVHARRRIGGVTADVFGACIELTETSVLVTGVLLT
ncbi:MAG: adenosylcobinamide-GDP ribazoletransferase [Acidobacteria bacterium]|nr:adenosylcobinamide-GDP ribazoletransferase [Acidobacteriota bacterium]